MGKYRALSSLCEHLVTADKLFQIIMEGETKELFGMLNIVARLRYA